MLVTALEVEARPLIARFGLKIQAGSRFRIYEGDGMQLLVTGMGKLQSAVATSAALEKLPGRASVVNIGICGSNRHIGEAFRANKIHDHASGQSWYPVSTDKRILPGICVETMDKPCENYYREVAYEMEASGFYSAAVRFTSSELIEVIKIVSDNPESPMARLKKKSAAAEVEQLIENQLDSITEISSELTKNAVSMPCPDSIDQLVSAIELSVHTTVSQGHTLRRLLQRHDTLTGGLPSLSALQSSKHQSSSAAAIISTLQRELEDIKPAY